MARVCCVPGCPEIAIDKRHCEAHQPKPKERKPKTKRPSAHKRGYTHRRRQERDWILNQDPWCGISARHGKGGGATVVDHNEPEKGDQEKFWRKDNWQPLCARHRTRKTATEDRRDSWGLLS